MPFLAPVFTAVGAAISSVAAWAAASPILAGIVQTAFGIAAKYALGAMLREKPKPTAAKLETEYGADLVRSVGLGYYATAGHHIFRNASGKGNRLVRDVYVVSHFRITDVPRIKFEGEWVTLASLPTHPQFGKEINSNTFAKVYFGTMTQTADADLIARSNPAGRWTADHRGAGVAYVIITSNLNREFTSPFKPLFEVKGAPLYDWRKDTTVGGSGSHRWNDQNTWEFSENPIVQMYNLERGIFNGTQKMVGKGVSASRLPLSQWSLAANIADEIVDGIPRYRSSLIATSGANVTHNTNMEPLLEACAGSWVERVDGEYPIAGAERAVSFTITDDALVREASHRVSLKSPRVELINTVASQFPSPESFYEMVPGANRVDTVALAEDGEILASSIPYDAVIYSKQVDRLADIAIRAARYQGNAEITIRPEYLDYVKPGQWMRWNSAKYGDITWQILTVSLGPLRQGGARNITMALKEIAPGVFDPTAYTNDPPGPPVTGVPDYLAELQGFVATPNLVQGSTGTTLPGVRLSWTAIDDVTVTSVQIEYNPIAQPTVIFKKIVSADVSSVQIVEGLTSSTDWRVRTILITDPARPVAYSAYTNFTTMQGSIADLYPIDVDKLADDLKGYMDWTAGGLREVKRQLEEIALHINDLDYGNFTDRQEIRRTLSSETGRLTADYDEKILVATGPNSAIAERLTTLNVRLIDAQDDIIAQASATELLTTRVTIAEGEIDVNTAAITSLTATVNTKADASAVTALTARVTTAEGDIDANSSAITSLTATVNGKADASAVTSLTARVSTVEGQVTSQAEAITALQSDYNGVSANATFRMATAAAPSGWTARIAMQARVNSGSTFRTAGIYLDSTTTLARVAIVADQFVISSGTDTAAPFIFSGGEAIMNLARIGTIRAGRLLSLNNKMDINLTNGTIEIYS
ncbi:putative tail protein [Sinorhizobium phage HMSP1-Susan]|nr:putative tail protein [Sinorhizobium phage HMSP1-Susan]